MAININKALDKAWESKTLAEIADAPPSALAGLSENHDKALAALGIKTIRDLAEWKHAGWARAIVELSKQGELDPGLAGSHPQRATAVRRRPLAASRKT